MLLHHLRTSIKLLNFNTSWAFKPLRRCNSKHTSLKYFHSFGMFWVVVWVETLVHHFAIELCSVQTEKYTSFLHYQMAWTVHHHAFSASLESHTLVAAMVRQPYPSSLLTSNLLAWPYTLSTSHTRPSDSSWSLNHDPTYHAHINRLIKPNTIYHVKNHAGNTHIWCKDFIYLWCFKDGSRIELLLYQL